MGLRHSLALAAAAGSRFALRRIVRRDGANFPGKVALAIDPKAFAALRGRVGKKSLVVVGTNGKTTVTNLVADALERTGSTVACNRTGANLDSGVASILMEAPRVDYGVFEVDELWLAKILPDLKSDYLLLLNLFRDQLDRCGEIATIQDGLVRALQASPETVLVYNADDPLCREVAERAGNPSVAFGIAQDLGLPQNTVADSHICPNCSTVLGYDYLHYGQLGAYRCPSCGFARPALDRAAVDVDIRAARVAFTVEDQREGGSGNPAAEVAGAAGEAGVGSTGDRAGDAGGGYAPWRVSAPFGGAYMVYNALAAATASELMGAGRDDFEKALTAFAPENGRLQHFCIDGRSVLLNLAKNPTGFNQNLRFVTGAGQKRAAAFFLNDREADGRDVSWIWDVDFEELADGGETPVFASGLRAGDLSVRLKYAEVPSERVGNVREVLEHLQREGADRALYVIANYTALPQVRADLVELARESAGRGVVCAHVPKNASPELGEGEPASAAAAAEAAAAAPADAAPADPAQTHDTEGARR